MRAEGGGVESVPHFIHISTLDSVLENKDGPNVLNVLSVMAGSRVTPAFHITQNASRTTGTTSDARSPSTAK